MSELLCHCGFGGDVADHLGHTPGEPGCEAPKVTSGTYVSRTGSRPGDRHHSVYGVGITSQQADSVVSDVPGKWINIGSLNARGTCPDCGKTGVRVTRRQVRTADRPDLHDLTVGALVAVQPAMAPHKVKGKPCSGEGKVPTETRYRSSQLDAMVRDFGAESVA